MRKLCILLGLTTSLYSSSAFAQAGSLDLSFDTDGKKTFSYSKGIDIAYASAIQSDGKIVVGGTSATGVVNEFALMRLNPDGSFDNSFSSDGVVTTKFSSGGATIYSVVIQTDGKIVAAGYSGSKTAIARYNTDGTLDNTFDIDGMNTISILSSNYCKAFDLALQADGKLLVAGETESSAGYDIALARFNTDGTLDNTFDGDGKLNTTVSSYCRAKCLAIQSDGKIVVAGHSGSSTTDIVTLRYNTNGTLDPSFDGDGYAITNVNTYDLAADIAIQKDSKIVVVGSADAGTNNNFMAIRLNADGSLDASFDGDGKVEQGFFSTLNDNAYSLLIQSDNKIVIGGNAGNVIGFSLVSDFGLMRLNPDGSLDNSFDSDGKVTSDFGSKNDYVYGLALQADDKIVAVGYANMGSTADSIDFAIARYDNNIGSSIQEKSMSTRAINIYPNPNNGLFEIRNVNQESLGKIFIQNSLGEWVYSNFESNSIAQIDLSTLSKGIYFISIANEQRVFQSKIIIND